MPIAEWMSSDFGTVRVELPKSRSRKHAMRLEHFKQYYSRKLRPGGPKKY
jgi:hypothetical protein